MGRAKTRTPHSPWRIPVSLCKIGNRNFVATSESDEGRGPHADCCPIAGSADDRRFAMFGLWYANDFRDARGSALVFPLGKKR
jgi:hypothetical protein